jgi:molecular chaperone GrpE (heat shock protein)
MKTLNEEKSEWQVKAEEYLDDLKRTQADFENYKKRQQSRRKSSADIS